MAVLKCALFLSMFQVVRGAVYQHKVTPKLTPLANYLGATAVAGGRGNSTITVQPQSKALEWYVVDIAVGTPPQHFHVWFSTGWSEFWVTDSGCMLYHLGQAPFAPCPVEPQPGYKRAFFNESASSTLKKANRGRAELYFANGWLATDVFQLGGLQIKNMSVVLADRLDDDFETEFRALKNWPIDGILGLGTGTPWDNTGAWASPLQQIVPLLDRPMFTFALSGYSFGTYSKSTRDAAVEFNTGNGGLQLPGGLMTRIVKAARAEYDFPTELYLCNCNVKLPDIVITIGGRNYSIPSSEYVLDIQYKPGRCVLDLSSGDYDDEGPFNFGDPFYRTYCTSFDVGQQKIGFAKSLI